MFNERTGTALNNLQFPTDIIMMVVLWRLRYKLSLRDLVETFAVRVCWLRKPSKAYLGVKLALEAGFLPHINWNVRYAISRTNETAPFAVRSVFVVHIEALVKIW